MTFKAQLLFLATVLVFGPSGNAFAAEVEKFTIGYLEITGDPRYEEKRAYARIRVKPHDRPLAGAELAMHQSRIPGRAIKMEFTLERATAENAKGLVAQIHRMKLESGIRFFLVDTNAIVLSVIAKATADNGIVLFNISDYYDRLRGAECQPHLLHTIPSHAMLTDALTQFLVFKKWRKVLLLRGAEPDDMVYASAFIRSAKRYGIKITETHEFKHGNDPRQRDKNNVALLTSGSNADVVFIADIEGEFGRYVPYQTNPPLLVFGTEGLQATSWHWAWERHGAPQLNQRFEKHAKRRMQGPDWAAWTAAKSIIESVIRTRSTDFKKVQTYLLSDKLNLDVYKGAPASYRLWDNQLRQPILLHSHNAIIDRAPIRGFLHQTENMDTLGDDIGDKRCQFQGTK